MYSINWQQFGLKKDPYDTLPLVEGGDLPIEKAFVGRDDEKLALGNLFESHERLCLTICGDVGVGKTSLANFHKYIWKYHTQKLLFSFRREIEACDDLLNKRSFLIEIIASVIREIKLLDPRLAKQDLLKKLDYLVDISQSAGFSGGVEGGVSIYNLGVNFSRDKSGQSPIQLSMSALEGHFLSLIKFIKENEINGRKYSGLIVHVNNFDVVLGGENGKTKVIKFFNEIRDILQTPDIYFIFLGPKNFFKDTIAEEQRIKGIFVQTPLMINPLSKTEIVSALDERMEFLKSPDVAGYIKPIENEVIYQLYDLYEGDIRSIMSAIKDILGQCSDKLAQPLKTNQALFLLGKERLERVKLTIEQVEVLKCFVESDKPLSQKDVIKKMGKSQSNISFYYIKPLKDMNIIEEKYKEGKTIFFSLTKDYEPLKAFFGYKKEIIEDIKNKYKQLSLL